MPRARRVPYDQDKRIRRHPHWITHRTGHLGRKTMELKDAFAGQHFMVTVVAIALGADGVFLVERRKDCAGTRRRSAVQHLSDAYNQPSHRAGPRDPVPHQHRAANRRPSRTSAC